MEVELFVRRSILVVVWTFLVIALAYSDEEAVTAKGRRVILHDDGTWVEAGSTTRVALDFRNTSWGMTKAEVLAAESLESESLLFEDERFFVASAQVAGFSADVVYVFAYGKLVRTKYAINAEHANRTLFIDQDLPRLKELLQSKYGSPQDDNQYWRNDLYKDDKSNWGMALAVGHLSYYVSWKTETTNILLYLSGDNYDITLGIEYSSIALAGMEDKEVKEQAAGDL